MDAVPFHFPSPSIPFVIMEGRAEGREPAQVLLDTGAAAPFTVLISPALAKRAGVVVKAKAVHSNLAVGAPVSFIPTRLRQFRLGSISLRNVSTGVTTVLDAVSAQIGYRIDAIVGHRFLEGRIITIDYPQRVVDFTGRPGAARTAIPFTLAPKRPLTLVRARLNGRGPFLFALDTGASATVISPQTADAAGIARSSTTLIGGAGGAAARLGQVGKGELSLGPLRPVAITMAVADVLGSIRGVSGAELDGVIGADLFSKGKLTIDYRTNRLWIEDSETIERDR